MENTNINTKEIVSKISEVTELSSEDVTKVLDSLQKIMKKELFKGKRVKLRNIGSFLLLRKPDRVHKGFGKEFKVNESYKLKFIPSIKLRSRNSFSELNNLFQDEQ